MIMDLPLFKGADASLLQAMLNASADAIIATDKNNAVLEWNSAAEHIFGYSRQEAVGQQLLKLILPMDQRKTFQLAQQNLLAKNSEANCEQTLRLTAMPKSAQEFPASFRLQSNNSRIGPHSITVVRDLSDEVDTADTNDRRLFQTRLIHQAHMLAATAESTEEALKHYVYVLCEITNWPIGHIFLRDKQNHRLVSKGIWHIPDGPEMDRFREETDSILFERGIDLPGRVWAAETPIWIKEINADADFLRQEAAKACGIVSAYAIPIFYEGEVLAVAEFFMQSSSALDHSMLGVVNAVARQFSRAVEAKVTQTQRDRLAAIVDVSADAIIALSQFGVILSWNKGAELLYGHTELEAVGSHVSLILPGDSRETEAEIRTAIHQGQNVLQFETIRRHKDGRLLSIAISAAPLKDSQGRIVGSAQIERDITESRRREEDLQLARKTAESANRAKDEFLANISHELRTPLNAILGMVELSLAGKLDTTIRDYLVTVRESSHILLGLLNDLLDLSRMEVGKFELEPQPFRLRDMIQSTMKSLSVRAFQKGLDFTAAIDADVPDHCLGDGRRIRQILVNLLGNSFKFTEAGEVTVRAVQVRRDGDLAMIRFIVHDTGIGISTADMRTIFEPFTQVDPSTTRRYQGSGLGLAISKGILSQMGGRIWVESELGRGATFYVEIGLQVLPDPELVGRRREQTTLENLKGAFALIVEEDETNASLLSAMLTSYGMVPRQVKDGSGALKALREFKQRDAKLRLVVSSALLSDMDGFSLVDKISEAGWVDCTTILLLSQADRQMFRGQLEQSKVSQFVDRPISQAKLLQAVVASMPSQKTPTAELLSKSAEVPLRILVAEDMPANLKVVKGVLERRAHKVTTVSNGAEAVAQVRDFDFDLVLMDVQMPKTDGLEATRQIRALDDPLKATIPILAMTAHAMRRDREKCIAAGMDDYISKPIDASILCTMVERFGVRNGPAMDALPPKESSPNNASKQDSLPPVLDIKGALNRLDQDYELLAELMSCVFDDSQTLLSRLVDAEKQARLEEVARMAHSMKGLACNVGGKQVTATANQLEEVARAHDKDQVAEKLAALADGVAAMREAIRKHLAK